jgi:cephalosporin hydroxylase
MTNEKIKTFKEIYLEHEGRICHKWSSYLDVYERVLSRFRNRPLKLLEIGVYHGGSLQMWKKYFGPEAQLVGVDIDPRCLDYAEENITIETGDQSSGEFWKDFFARHGEFDIIIDDGSHHNQHQTLTFMMAWPFLKDGGTFLVEDLHCAYWAEYGGGYRSKMSFIEFAKDRADDINAFWSKDPNSFRANQFTNEMGAISFYDSIVVFEKIKRAGPSVPVATGQWSRQVSDMEIKGFESAFAAADRMRNQ